MPHIRSLVGEDLPLFTADHPVHIGRLLDVIEHEIVPFETADPALRSKEGRLNRT